MKILDTEISGVKLLTPKVFEDERGLFFESYKKKDYEFLGCSFVQDNFSVSKKNVLRGLHLSNQNKLVGVMSGTVFDVVVDLRKSSPTYLKWQSFLLDDISYQQIFIPVGCAHGFCVLSERANVFYKVSEYYDLKKEKGIRFDDPTIGVKWPVKEPILSKRDKGSPFLKESECIFG